MSRQKHPLPRDGHDASYTPLPGEEWRRVQGVKHVIASNKGRVIVEPHQVATPNGMFRYAGGFMVTTEQCCIDNRVLTVRTLIAETWLGPKPEPHLVVRYKDGDKNNRCADNLVWAMRGSSQKVPTRCFGQDGRPLRMDSMGMTR